MSIRIASRLSVAGPSGGDPSESPARESRSPLFFHAMQEALAAEGLELTEATLEQMEEKWQEAK